MLHLQISENLNQESCKTIIMVTTTGNSCPA